MDINKNNTCIIFNSRVYLTYQRLKDRKMDKELKQAVRDNVCFQFLTPELDNNCGGETKSACMACAKDFVLGWNAHKKEEVK